MPPQKAAVTFVVLRPLARSCYYPKVAAESAAGVYVF